MAYMDGYAMLYIADVSFMLQELGKQQMCGVLKPGNKMERNLGSASGRTRVPWNIMENSNIHVQNGLEPLQRKFPKQNLCNPTVCGSIQRIGSASWLKVEKLVDQPVRADTKHNSEEKYPAVIKHGTGKYTIQGNLQVIFLLKPPFQWISSCHV